jgi:predicted nucleic acid-binding protein
LNSTAKEKAFIDSNILIYLLSADAGKADPAEFPEKIKKTTISNATNKPV